MEYYNTKTKQLEIPFKDYQTEISFPKYEKREIKEKETMDPSQLELKLKY